MVQQFTSLEGVNLINTWLTIGSFDGVHIGHQRLIRSFNESAHQNGEKSVVLTFHPHPITVLKGVTGAFYLTTPIEKIKLLDDLGTDVVITYPFTIELSECTAAEFIRYLSVHLGFKQLWAGKDFALGKNREGNTKYLEGLGNDFNYRTHIFDLIMTEGTKISSTHIRNLLVDGSIEEANTLLGRKYQVMGEVIHGDGRGKSIGIPTANIETGNEKLIPGAGVYACKVIINNDTLPAAVNIGIRPTFESSDNQAHVEAHILDFTGDLYGQTIAIQFVSRLRGEHRFMNVGELINQINYDILKTRQIIKIQE